MRKLTRSWGIVGIGAVIVFGLTFGVILTGCATSVPIKSVRPPTIDTTNIQRMAIKEFENRSGVGGAVGAQLTRHLTDIARQTITNAGKFTIVAATDPNADGVFTGEITSIDSKDSHSQTQRTDKEGNVITTITYRRDVSVSFNYSVNSSRTGMPVGTVRKQGSNSSYSTNSASSLVDTLTLARRIVDSQLRQLHQDIVPTIVSTNRKLMDETSKDKAVKQLMKMAQALVKNGNYEEAIKQYEEIDREHGSVAARTNAGIIRQAISSDIAARAELAELFADTDGLAGKAVKSALDELNSKLPAKSNIMIMKTSSDREGRLDYVVDTMIKNIVLDGKLQVVDRQNLELVNTEQQYQLSGNVSDASMVSIGQQLGAQYIVLCRISGEMSGRRLSLRVLDVKTTRVLIENSFEI